MGSWTYRSRETGVVRDAELQLRWQVDGSSVSDNYLFEEMDAFDLFDLWADKQEDDIIDVYLSVEPEGEYAPFQLNEFADGEDFLTFWTVPVDPATGNPANWLTLPVLDGLWNAAETTSGGFIQEASGWKPSALQPTVSLLALRAAVESRRP